MRHMFSQATIDSSLFICIVFAASLLVDLLVDRHKLIAK